MMPFPYDGSGGLTPPDGDRLTLQDFIFSTYNSLLDAGWRMQEIDQMDMLGFLKVRAWNSNRAKEKAVPKERYIDEVWPELKPRTTHLSIRIDFPVLCKCGILFYRKVAKSEWAKTANRRLSIQHGLQV